MSIWKLILSFFVCLFISFQFFVAELATGITGQKKEMAKTSDLICVPPPKKKPKKIKETLAVLSDYNK